MPSETVRAMMGWDDSHGLTSLVYQAERYFAGLLTSLFPTGEVSSSLPHSGVDITLTYKMTTFLIQLKVTRSPELLPPIQLQDTVESLQWYKRPGPGPQQRFVLLTNYYLPPAMVERLAQQGLATLRFSLDDADDTLRQSLCDLIEPSVARP